MKYSIKTIVLVTLLGLLKPGFAQQTMCGLYKTENDFIVNNLTYKVDCKTDNETILADSFFNASRIIVKSRHHRLSLQKKDFFGFKDCNNRKYRFYYNQVYEIIDTTAFFLYTHMEHSIKGRGYTYSVQFYFSLTGKDALRTFTISHLIDSFPAAIKFHYALQSFEYNPAKLLDYDMYAKMYKIKYVYKESLK